MLDARTAADAVRGEPQLLGDGRRPPRAERGVSQPAGATYYDDRRVAAAYDRVENQGLPGDVTFYVELALASQGIGAGVLELGAGTGRVAIPIAEAGLEVVGLDASDAMLERARERSQAVNGIQWVRGDMADFAMGRTFGLVIIPFRSFLHLLTAREQASCLRCVYEHLVPGGRLALNFFNPSILPLGESTGERGSVSRAHGRIRLRYVFRSEMEALLAAAGFEVESLFGGFDRAPFGETSSEMVWVARKPSG